MHNHLQNHPKGQICPILIVGWSMLFDFIVEGWKSDFCNNSKVKIGLFLIYIHKVCCNSSLVKLLPHKIVASFQCAVPLLWGKAMHGGCDVSASTCLPTCRGYSMVQDVRGCTPSTNCRSPPSGETRRAYSAYMAFWWTWTMWHWLVV